MPQKDKSIKNEKRGKGQSSWNPEMSFDGALTIEDLIASPPFNDPGGKNNSFSIGARIPGWMVRRLAKLSESKSTPYELHSDVVRDALYIGLRVLSVRYKSNPQWEAEVRMAQAVDKVGTIQRVRSQIQELSKGLEALVSNGDTVQAAYGLEEYLEPVIEIEDTWYKKKIIQFLYEEKTTRYLIDKCSEPIRKAIEKIQNESKEDNKH